MNGNMANGKRNGKRVTQRDILLNIPNTIGYVRTTLYVIGIWRTQYHDYAFAASMFFLNCVLDAADGIAARRFNQCSQFGAILDVILDVLEMSMWKAVLAQLYPDYAVVIHCHAGLTLLGEWMHRHSTIVQKSGTHFQSNSTNPILRIYYGTKLGHDFFVWSYWCFWLMLYIVHYTTGPTVPIIGVGIWQLLLTLSVPFLIFRFFVLLSKIKMAVIALVALDTTED